MCFAISYRVIHLLLENVELEKNLWTVLNWSWKPDSRTMCLALYKENDNYQQLWTEKIDINLKICNFCILKLVLTNVGTREFRADITNAQKIGFHYS